MCHSRLSVSIFGVERAGDLAFLINSHKVPKCWPTDDTLSIEVLVYSLWIVPENELESMTREKKPS